MEYWASVQRGIVYVANSICNNTDLGTVKINRNICREQMKISVKTEYFKLVRPDLKSKLNAGNVFLAINIWAIPT